MNRGKSASLKGVAAFGGIIIFITRVPAIETKKLSTVNLTTYFILSIGYKPTVFICYGNREIGNISVVAYNTAFLSLYTEM